MTSEYAAGHSDQTLSVCAICWNASNHKPRPQLSIEGKCCKDNKCIVCKQAWKPIRVGVTDGRYIEIRPLPKDVSKASRVCETVRRRGRCQLGSRCPFAHSELELRTWRDALVQRHGQARGGSTKASRSRNSSRPRIRKPDPHASGLCLDALAGKCQNPTCGRAHEFRACPRFFNGKGSCDQADACPYAHSDKELSTWNNWLSRTPLARSNSSALSVSPGSPEPFGSDTRQSSSASSASSIWGGPGPEPLAHSPANFGLTKRFRNPPLNVHGEYRMCRFVASNRACHFGPEACTFAHSQEELEYWQRLRKAEVERESYIQRKPEGDLTNAATPPSPEANTPSAKAPTAVSATPERLDWAQTVQQGRSQVQSVWDQAPDPSKTDQQENSSPSDWTDGGGALHNLSATEKDAERTPLASAGFPRTKPSSSAPAAPSNWALLLERDTSGSTNDVDNSLAESLKASLGKSQWQLTNEEFTGASSLSTAWSPHHQSWGHFNPASFGLTSPPDSDSTASQQHKDLSRPPQGDKWLHEEHLRQKDWDGDRISPRSMAAPDPPFFAFEPQEQERDAGAFSVTDEDLGRARRMMEEAIKQIQMSSIQPSARDQQNVVIQILRRLASHHPDYFQAIDSLVRSLPSPQDILLLLSYPAIFQWAVEQQSQRSAPSSRLGSFSQYSSATFS